MKCTHPVPLHVNLKPPLANGSELAGHFLGGLEQEKVEPPSSHYLQQLPGLESNLKLGESLPIVYNRLWCLSLPAP